MQDSPNAASEMAAINAAGAQECPKPDEAHLISALAAIRAFIATRHALGHEQAPMDVKTVMHIIDCLLEVVAKIRAGGTMTLNDFYCGHETPACFGRITGKTDKRGDFIVHTHPAFDFPLRDKHRNIIGNAVIDPNCWHGLVFELGEIHDNPKGFKFGGGK